MEFNKAKAAYENCRERERQLIRDHLLGKGFSVSLSPRAGKGLGTYTSSGRLKQPYDLRNWKYISAKKNDKEMIISLQAFDQDQHSKNRHVLYDRIGIFVFSQYSADAAFQNMITTDIDLPMDSCKFAMLDDLIDKMI